MTPETFIEQFETFAEAPNGVAKLRELILQLAVQGKLGTQDENDEPAGELARQIVEYRKATTGRTGSIALLTSNEIGFALPSGWIAARFGDLVVNRDGERVPVSREIREGRKGPYDYYGASGVIDCIDDFLFDKPLLLIGEDGANLINRSTPIAFIAQGKYWVNNHAHVLDGISLDFLRYIELHINAIDLKPFVTGTAQPKMNQAKMNSIPVALPPLAEQRRIVAKVDQLLGLCDELAARQAARREARAALVGATLDRLVSARSSADQTSRHPACRGGSTASALLDPAADSSGAKAVEPLGQAQGRLMEDDAHRLRDHFDRLFDTPTTIPQLRQAILQLAVQGQLVPQDPNDEPATVLLALIKSERERRALAKEIPNQKAVPPITSEDRLFALPCSWTWARFGDLCLFIEAGLSPTCEARPRINHEWGVLKISAVTWDTFNPDENKALPSTVEPHPECEVRPGDFLMTRANTAELVAKSVVVEETPPRLLLNDKTLRVVFPDSVNRRYVNLFNNGLIARQHYMRVASGTSESMRNVSRDNILVMPVPVPPLAEQKRIVSKVTELLSLCDALEAKLTQAESASTQLLSAAVHHLLNRAVETAS